MKIVDRKTFLQMPNGTVFCKFPLYFKGNGHDYAFDISSPNIKDESIGDVDFFFTDLGGDMMPIGHCNDSHIDVLFDMVKNLGKEVPFETYSGRDGLYEGDNVGFAIYSKAEVQEMIDQLQQALKDGYEK